MHLLKFLGALLRFAARQVAGAGQPQRRQRAQGLVEYALLLMLIAIVVVGAVTTTGRRISTTYSKVECGLAGAQGTPCAAAAAPPAPTPCVVAGNSGVCPGGLNP